MSINIPRKNHRERSKSPAAAATAQHGGLAAEAERARPGQPELDSVLRRRRELLLLDYELEQRPPPQKNTHCTLRLVHGAL